MIQQLHKLLTSNSITRGMQRSVVRRIKRTLDVPDAFADLEKLVNRTSPDAILDIGSHIGGTIARMLEFASLPIHGFEPTSESYARLKKRFDSNELVTLHNLALSNESGQATIHCNANEQTNSLLDNDSGNTAALSEQTKHLGQQTIDTMRLDEWSQKHAPNQNLIIKSDVQGAEGLLLAGGMETFRNQLIAFYSEAQIAAMYEGQADFCSLHKTLTEELGFVLHNIYPCFHDEHGRALQTDALWIKQAYLVK